MRHYLLQIGYEEWCFYRATDAEALRLADRLRRLSWPKRALRICQNHRGSMAHAEVCGWHGRPAFRLGWWPVDDAGVIGCGRAAMVFDTTTDPFIDPWESSDEVTR